MEYSPESADVFGVPQNNFVQCICTFLFAFMFSPIVAICHIFISHETQVEWITRALRLNRQTKIRSPWHVYQPYYNRSQNEKRRSGNVEETPIL